MTARSLRRRADRSGDGGRSTAVPIVVGKPHPFMIEQSLKHLGTSKEETVMIGDLIATDIVAGHSAGLRAILLASDVPSNARRAW